MRSERSIPGNPWPHDMVISIDEPNNICQAWSRAWRWYAIADPQQRVTSELLRRLSTPDQPLHPAFPPFWQTEYGDEGVDSEAFEKWQRASRPEMLVALESTPERICLDALIAAWKAGLETVVTLPYDGYFAQRISAKHLVVSAATRAHPESYNQALASPVIADWKP